MGAVVVSIIAGVSVFGTWLFSDQKPTHLVTSATSDRLQEQRRYPAARVRLDPPPQSARASVTSQEAYAAFKKTGSYTGAEKEAGSPLIELANYSNDGFGQIGAGEKLTPFHQNRLVWVLTFRGTTCWVAGPMNRPSPAQKPRCILLVFVDAGTGEALNAVEVTESLEVRSGGS